MIVSQQLLPGWSKGHVTMNEQRMHDLQNSYDRVAQEYVERIFGELEHKPLDRELLDRFAERVRNLGLVCDLGCGPGHVARYLRERGVEVCGVDLSPGMVEQARQLSPDIPFKQGNMLALDWPDAAWAGVAAFYSIIHIPRGEVVRALCEIKRVLRPGGTLLLAFHLGEEVVHLEEWWNQPVSLDFAFFGLDEMEGYLQTAGFEIEELIERPPYPDVEHQSRRGYIFATKPERKRDARLKAHPFTPLR
jgi:SAM-dependent methyltransferase